MSTNNNLPFKVEYAKSGRSKCKTSKTTIPKGTLRLGIMVKSPHFDGMQPNWHAARAFFETNRRKRPQTTDEIDGFDDLRPQDQAQLEAWIGAYSKAKSTKGKKKKDMEKEDPNVEMEQQNLKQAVREQQALVWKIRDLVTGNGNEKEALYSGTIRDILKAHRIPLEGLGPTALPGLLAELVVFGVPPPGKGCCDSTQPLQFCPHAGKYVCKAPQAWGECTYSQSVDDTICQPMTAPICNYAQEWWQAVLTLCNPAKPQKRLFLPKTAVVKGITPLSGTKRKASVGGPPTLTKRTKFKPELSRACVDPDAGMEYLQGFHVLDESHGDPNEPFPLDLWDTILCNTDLTTGTNSLYKLQLLVPDRTNTSAAETQYCCLWRQWGRVGRIAGEKGGGEMHTPFRSVEEAKAEFRKLFKRQTGNQWEDRKNFVKKPKLFMQMDISYTVDDKEQAKKSAGPCTTIQVGVIDPTSKLDPRVQQVISTMFDPNTATQQLEEMNIDLAKMPLGKMTEAQLIQAYTVLTEIETVVGDTTLSEGAAKDGKLKQLSNQFFSICPTVTPVLIDSMSKLKDQIELVDELLNLHASDEVINDKSIQGPSKAPVDEAYDKLKSEFIPLDPTGAQYAMLKQYVGNTRNATLQQNSGVMNDWGQFGLRLLDAFEVHREGEQEMASQSKQLGNRRLLWHGSHIGNYTGILSKGLRIAPPEAPMSGYRFGKGIYFADLLGKSAGYCRSHGSSEMFVLLCDVSLGQMYEARQDKYMETAQPGTNSTHALSQIVPDPMSSMVLNDGSAVPSPAPGVSSLGQTSDAVLVPMGKSVPNKLRGRPASCDASEFIVYDQAQVQIRFLLRLTTDPSTKAADEAGGIAGVVPTSKTSSVPTNAAAPVNPSATGKAAGSVSDPIVL